MLSLALFNVCNTSPFAEYSDYYGRGLDRVVICGTAEKTNNKEKMNIAIKT